jgi:hypothetical protein
MGQTDQRTENGSHSVSWAYGAGASAILLIPCLWQHRIQAGDLSSHIYNAWLAQQIDIGKAPALTIAPVTTNVLFDLILSWLFRSFGAEGAQRIAVSLAVLIFFWGAFALASATSKATPWFLVPCLAMLTYGWVFYMGFFNFYLAAGLSLWALALNLKRGVIPHLVAAALLVIAYMAHAIPPLWAGCVIAYTLIAQRLERRPRLFFFGFALCGIFGISHWLVSRYPTYSSSLQALEASAIDQVWVFGLKYLGLSIGLALLWGFVLLGVSSSKGMLGIIGEIPFQLCILMAFGIYMFPTRIELPQYRMALSFITERMTLLQGVLICAFLAAAKPPNWLSGAFWFLAVIYFSFLYSDTGSLNKMERRMETLTAGLSTNDRVFSSFRYLDSKVGLLDHTVDRVCLGKCLSYGNYEPVSAQFRIRVTAPNPMVVATTADYAGLRDGGYTVKPTDLPLFQIALCDENGPDLCLKRLEAGDVTKQYLLPQR